MWVRILCVSFLLWANSIWAQSEVFDGRLVNDSLELENIHIINKRTGTGVLSDSSGNFTISAKSSDTLMISSLVIRSRKYTVRSVDLESRGRIEIPVEYRVTPLQEVYVNTYGLTGSIESDIKDIPVFVDALPLYTASQIIESTYPYTDDSQSKVRNIADPTDITANSIDLLGLLSLATDLISPKKDKRVISKKALTTYFQESFYHEQLNIPEHRVLDFIDYVDHQSGIDSILATHQPDVMELTALLINYADQFLNRSHHQDSISKN